MVEGSRTRFGLWLAAAVVVVLGYVERPSIEPGVLPGGDAQEYAHMAASLLHASYLVDYDGPARVTRFTPGFPLMMTPAVALGGLEAGVWVPYLAGLVVAALVSLLAWRVRGGLAAPVAAVLTLSSPGVALLARQIMSDLPSAAMVVGELTVITLSSRRSASAAAGLVGGALVWVRPGTLVLVIAVVVGLWGERAWSRRLAWYAIGLILPLAALGAWQWMAFGSPLLTSYQGAGAGIAPGLGGFFSTVYIWGPPWNAAAEGPEPNAVVYGRTLLGFGTPYLYPGAGALGIVGAALYVRARGVAGIAARFALATNILTYLLYVAYFYRDERFMLVPVVLSDVFAAVMCAAAIGKVARYARQSWTAHARRTGTDSSSDASPIGT